MKPLSSQTLKQMNGILPYQLYVTNHTFGFMLEPTLINKNGHALGSLCVVDFEPREIPYEKVENLKSISRQVVAQMELRETND